MRIMVSPRIVYSFARYWRCYFLLTVASVLSFMLIYLSQNDPDLEHYFPYFRSKYYYLYMNGAAEDMEKLMEKNSRLDYEFSHANSRLCMRHYQLRSVLNGSQQPAASSSNDGSAEFNFNIDEDYALLNAINDDVDTDNEQIKSSSKKQQLQQQKFVTTSKLRLALLSISQAANFKYRQAARQTWSRRLNKHDTRLIFFVGDPHFIGASGEATNFSKDDQLKLEKEMSDYGDIVQIHMPDNDNYTTSKTLVALRWAITYCPIAQSLFVLSDSAVLNYDLFNRRVMSMNLEDIPEQVEPTIAGFCNYTDERFALALKYFFGHLHKENQNLKKSQLDAEKQLEEAEKKAHEQADQEQQKRNASSLSSGGNTKRQDSQQQQQQLQRRSVYKGQFCSNLGWLVSMSAARRLWFTALRTPYMLRLSPAYLNGYLAFKAQLRHVNLASGLVKYYDQVPVKSNCLKVFESEPDTLLCAENFTVASRYANYIASWNTAGQSQLVLQKL